MLTPQAQTLLTAARSAATLHNHDAELNAHLLIIAYELHAILETLTFLADTAETFRNHLLPAIQVNERNLEPTKT